MNISRPNKPLRESKTFNLIKTQLTSLASKVSRALIKIKFPHQSPSSANHIACTFYYCHPDEQITLSECSLGRSIRTYPPCTTHCFWGSGICSVKCFCALVEFLERKIWFWASNSALKLWSIGAGEAPVSPRETDDGAWAVYVLVEW